MNEIVDSTTEQSELLLKAWRRITELEAKVAVLEKVGKAAESPEQECEHRKLSYCHGSSLWVCAECDEGFNADEFRSQFMEPPEEGMTIANDGASELGKLMREQRQGGPVPDHI